MIQPLPGGQNNFQKLQLIPIGQQNNERGRFCSTIERRFFTQSQAVNNTANRLAAQQARDKSADTDEVNLLAEN